MFDKNIFDHSVYDRSVASDGITGDILSSGQMITKIVVAQPIPLSPFLGYGALETDIRILVPSGSIIESSGELVNSGIILRQSLAIGFNGSAVLSTLPTVKIPMGDINIVGSGDLEPITPLIYQHMSAKLSGSSELVDNITMKQELDLEMRGDSAFDFSTVRLNLPISPLLNGDGSLIMRRLGSLNEDLFQLIGINLQPGEEVTIDTDLFDVMFGYRPDVSSVTTDSVFFELNPGENEILIATDTQQTLQITAIWQNRWL